MFLSRSGATPPHTPANQIDLPGHILGSATVRAPETVSAEVAFLPSSIWESLLGVCAEEAPYFEVTNAFASVDEMQSRPLAEGRSYEPITVRSQVWLPWVAVFR